MQTILGVGGAIGTELVRELANARKQVRLVGRNPKIIQGATEAVSADISNLDQTVRAVSGSTVVYLLIGLKYLFDLTKFSTAFSLEPTSYAEGVRRTALACK